MGEEAPRRDHLYGGQALIEGVMMRGRDVWAIAVRKADGQIHIESHRIHSITERVKLLGKPGFRGIIALGQALAIGYRALMVSASESQAEEEKLEGWQMALSTAFAIFLFVGLFMVLPAFGFGYAERHWISSGFLANLLEGVVRILLFVGYIALIGRMQDIHRVFQYHGAEHKTITAYEHEDALTPENIDRYSTLHVRCGTNFLLITMVIAVLVFAAFGSPGIWWRMASRVVAIPVIAGIAYEALRLGARYERSAVMRGLMAPGLWLQKITTAQPDTDQIEVAIASLEAVLEAEAEEGAGEELGAEKGTSTGEPLDAGLARDG